MSSVHCPNCGSAFPDGAVYCPKCGTQGPTILSAERRAANAPGELPVSERLARALGAKYEVRRILGSGGFAEVYEVWDQDLQRKLAAKVLRPDVAWTAGMLARFKQEARAIARLNHANILPIHFIGEGEGLAFYVMPFVEGESLGQLLRRTGALPADRALVIARPILAALGHAHAAGLVHRDIKPDNVLIEASTGRVLLVDFGIAKLIDSGQGSGAHQTQTGFVVGTPHYMSPEQALGQGDIDHRTDIYAFGAMLFQMVTGAPPYEGESSQEIVGKHLAEPVPTPVDRKAGIPRWLSAVIVRCLAKKKEERYATAAEVERALDTGRASRPQQVERASAVADRIRGDAATARIPMSGERPAPLAPAITGRGLLVGVTAAVGVAAFVLLGARVARPRVTFVNHLATPVHLLLGSQVERVVLPGETVRDRVRRGASLAVAWHVARPVGADGWAMGEEIQWTPESLVVRQPVDLIADARGTAVPAFAPLITNATGVPLHVTVNIGSTAELDCRCTVPDGTVDAVVGYYRLFQNSSVRVTAPDGRTAQFTELGGKVDPQSGTVGLRFGPGDLR